MFGSLPSCGRRDGQLRSLAPGRAARLPAIAATGLAVLVLTLLALGVRGDDAPAPALPPAADKPIDFVRDVAPLFAEHCVSCHGSEMRESGLRLDRKTGFLGDTGRAIQPGKSAESLLIQYVAGADPEKRMPPDGDLLTAEQIGLLRAWIDQGANWPKELIGAGDGPATAHWAYQPIVRPVVPMPGASSARIANPIDAFVLDRLNQAGIQPSPEADRVTLVRRLSLDLIGLPPSPEEVDAWLNDAQPGAYERLVDRLLASEHFGERWGRHWLDMARYADSDGYEKDNPRPDAWRWRDWVIDAINRDIPFDQFTIEQLAGDLLPDADADRLLATAFHRQTLTNTEGGTDKEQFRVEAVFDRVGTTGAVWLGLTVGCAQCHSHKYDAISQAEFYRLFAFYNNGDETNADVPISDVAMAEYKTKKAEFDRQLSALDEQLKKRRAEIAPAVGEFESRLQAMLADNSLDTRQFHPLDAIATTSDGGATFSHLEDGSFLAAAEKNPDKATYTVTAQTNLAEVTGFRLEVLADPSLPAQGPGRSSGGNFVLSELQAFASKEAKIDVKKDSLPFRASLADFSQEKFDVAAAVDGNLQTGWAVSPQLGKPHSALFKLTAPWKNEGLTHLQLTLSQQYGSQHTIGRFRLMATTGDDPRDDVPAAVRQALAVAPEQRDQKQKDALLDYALAKDDAGEKLLARIEELRKSEPKAPLINVRVISQRTASPRTTHILHRGDFLAPQAEVLPGTLSVLHEFRPREKDGPPDRLDLARWLVDPANPLTPRVTVNHIWKHLFGAGLVRTVNDFGIRGDKPSHPQLLDWLAGEFIRQGWSRKGLIKLIVMSSTYRQSSTYRPELADVDPENVLLYRQNRFRVEGEIIRDTTLAASGLLSSKVGGPSVFPPMPADVAALSYANNFRWNTSTGEDRFRRGLYTFFKRTSPHPNLAMFDCPDANTTCVERSSSNTPLQALTTLNNETYVEASRGLAKRVLESRHGSDADRMAYAFRCCLARSPSAIEQSRLLELLDESRHWYQSHADDAKTLVGTYLPSDVAVEETAAWVATARILLNLDEFITRE